MYFFLRPSRYSSVSWPGLVTSNKMVLKIWRQGGLSDRRFRGCNAIWQIHAGGTPFLRSHGNIGRQGGGTAGGTAIVFEFSSQTTVFLCLSIRCAKNQFSVIILGKIFSLPEIKKLIVATSDVNIQRFCFLWFSQRS